MEKLWKSRGDNVDLYSAWRLIGKVYESIEDN